MGDRTQRHASTRYQSEEAILNILFPQAGIEYTTCRAYSYPHATTGLTGNMI